ASDRQHVKLAVGPECLFSLAALDQRARRQIAGVLGLRLQRAEPAFVLAARRSNAAALVEGDRAIGEKALHAGRVDHPQEPVGDGIVVRDHDVFGRLPAGRATISRAISSVFSGSRCAYCTSNVMPRLWAAACMPCAAVTQ